MGAVVVGFDKNINYYKIQYACLCIRENPGCLFIATNLDAVTHLTDAQEWAGNGAMVGAIKGMGSFAVGHLMYGFLGSGSLGSLQHCTANPLRRSRDLYVQVLY